MSKKFCDLPREFPTLRLRFVRRSPLEYSQRTELVLQQWWRNGRRGEWRDVPIESGIYPLPDGRTR